MVLVLQTGYATDAFDVLATYAPIVLLILGMDFLNSVPGTGGYRYTRDVDWWVYKRTLT